MKHVVEIRVPLACGLLAVLAAFTLSACQGDDQKAPAPASPSNHPVVSNRMVCDAGSDPYSCLRKACENARASFSEDEKICACESGSIFYSTYGGACIGASATDDRVSDFFYDIGKHHYVQDLYSSLTLREREDILRTRSIPVFAGKSQLVLFKDSSRFASLDDGFDDQLINLGFPTTELNWKSINDGFRNANMMLEASYQFFILPSHKELSLPDGAANERLQRALRELKTPSATKQNQVRSFSELGCAEICLENATLYDNQEATAYRLRIYSGGNPLQDTINIFNKATLEVETMLVLLNGKPSHYFVSLGQGRYDLYGNDGTRIKTVQEAVPTRPTPRFDSRTLQQTPVALFEGFYSPSVDATALYGPSTDTSYYGWFSKEELKPFYYGKIPTLLGEEDFTTPAHSHSVAKIASSDFEKPLLPLSATTLTAGEFSGIVTKLKGRKLVASVSIAFSNTAAICRKGEIARTVEATKETVLWSVGAGNQGSEISDLNVPFCPQSLISNNLLIVAATSGQDRISSASSYGETFADIAVGGCEFGNETCELGATSFAAPRLARVAADLMDEFPQVSVANIKIAMLATVQIPYSGNSRRMNRYLPVKSGGILDAKAARAFLRELSRSSVIDLAHFELKSLSQAQVNAIRDALLRARRHQYKDLAETDALKLVNDHVTRLMKLY